MPLPLKTATRLHQTVCIHHSTVDASIRHTEVHTGLCIYYFIIELFRLVVSGRTHGSMGDDCRVSEVYLAFQRSVIIFCIVLPTLIIPAVLGQLYDITPFSTQTPDLVALHLPSIKAYTYFQSCRCNLFSLSASSEP